MMVAALLGVVAEAQTITATFPDSSANFLSNVFYGTFWGGDAGASCQRVVINPNTRLAYKLGDGNVGAVFGCQLSVIDLATNTIVAAIPVPIAINACRICTRGGHRSGIGASLALFVMPQGRQAAVSASIFPVEEF